MLAILWLVVCYLLCILQMCGQHRPFGIVPTSDKQYILIQYSVVLRLLTSVAQANDTQCMHAFWEFTPHRTSQPHCSVEGVHSTFSNVSGTG